VLSNDAENFGTLRELLDTSRETSYALTMSSLLPPDAGYGPLLEDLKARIRLAQIRAALSVNRELVLLYWSIGQRILEAQKAEGWGAKVIDRLAADLRSAFPDMKGLSRSNLLYMRAFAEAWTDESIVQQVVGQIPWGHNVSLLDKLKSTEGRLWYARAAVEHGWSRNVLVIQIESRLHDRQGKAFTNFERALPPPQSDLARQLLKDPYNFEFLALDGDAAERELEKGLLEHIRKFLLELGAGFAFVGNQYHLEVGGDDYYIDLLFYHLKLRCYVVIELKTGKFKPEYAGKMNFYLAVVDDKLRHPDDAPSIGIILCKDKNQVAAEYALRGVGTPVGVAEFRVTETLPETLQGVLPTAEEFQKELGDPPAD
jgi:predicted nuclease of restriction endonuclease-like (RecB) superfamily